MTEVKGQAVFEFIFAAIVLFASILYILGVLNGEIASFSQSHQADAMNSRVIELSALLASGHEKYGLADSWPVLEHAKIVDFNNNCRNNYAELLNDLQLYESDPLGGKHNIHIKINAIDTETGQMLIDCGRTPANLAERPDVYEVKRIGIDSETGNPIELTIWLWK
ncbi:MAG: hypothetical protein GXO64_04190 [Candidatus Micrarchaeota archaeon]|nr:hypothetical protein [Candidatus Micrarchaeota archaeon]